MRSATNSGRAVRAMLCATLMMGLLVTAGGCAAGGGSGPRGGERKGRPADVQGTRWGNPVDVSRLREEAITLIELSSRSDDAQVRANAVEAASYSPRRLRPIIDAALSDRVPAVRSVAALAVARAQLADMLPRVEPLLNERVSHVRASALLAMSRNGVAIDPTPLADMLLNDPSPAVNRHAAWVLGELGNRSALPLLRTAATTRLNTLPPNQQRVFQIQLSEAMIKLGAAEERGVLRASMYPSQVEDLEATALATQVLGVLKDRESIGQLTSIVEYRALDGQRYPAEVRLGAAGALASMGVENAATLADEYVGSANPAHRAQSAFVYGNHPGPQYWDRLEVLLKDPEPLVRISAAAGVLRSGMR